MTAKSEQAMAEIEGQIARTRAELGATLDAAAIELAPRHLAERGVDMVTDFLSANRPDGISFGAAFRADPVPLALIGLGVAWLIAENLGLVGVKLDEASTAPGEAAASARRIVDPAEPALDGAEPQGEGWMHRAAGVAQGAMRSIVADGGAVLERAGGYLGKALPSGDSAQRAGGWLSGIERHPVLLGAVGLAAGAVVSLLLPTTRREQEIVGEAREDLWEKAEQFGHRAAESVRSLAEGSSHPGPGE